MSRYRRRTRGVSNAFRADTSGPGPLAFLPPSRTRKRVKGCSRMCSWWRMQMRIHQSMSDSWRKRGSGQPTRSHTSLRIMALGAQRQFP